MYEFDNAAGGLESSIRARRAAQESWPFPGRHESHEEIQEETPIFHALTVGGWRDGRRSGDAGNAVRRVHRDTVRTTRRGGAVRPTGDTVAAFHSEPAPVPAQPAGHAAREQGDGAWNAPGDAAMAMLRRRRDIERAADRAAIADLLGGAGRHRLTRSA
ncbi:MULTISPECIES: hypothetical protein [unclassified Pseudonocardia]|uniref:hypothetical protein n=1 Tax=unclassified Pseudonocardia TaxID=2619320 RepID=UPI00094B1341|nr:MULTISPECIES: hypothetical protein [unclassified Pseudonocardia]OLM34398.1 hypothetical protein Ae717Ps2_5294c [Pseudonocardia sp. Ae717_Ps2]